MKYFKFLLIFTLLFSHITTPNIYAYEMTLDDEEEDLDDFNSFITKAKNSANSREFIKAYDYLNRAKKLGVARSELKKAKEYIVRLENSTKTSTTRVDNSNQKSYTSSSKIKDVDFVYVKVEMVCGLFGTCIAKNLQISGGDGKFEPSFSGASGGSIYKGYNGIKGRYSWSATFGKNLSCSGSFYLSGKKSNYFIKVYKGCNDAGSSEH